jgi:hypothetical protein
MARDEFSPAVKEALAKRVAQRCSNPECKAPTTGPHTSSTSFINIGVASHITAAAPGGPRYDRAITSEERKSIENAIWLCQVCAKLIDSDCDRYTAQTIKNWKVSAESAALRDINGSHDSGFLPQPSAALHAPIPRIAGLAYDEAREKLVNAGWQPHRNHWTYASNFDMQYGNGLHFWEKGYSEIINASGTGLGHCRFGFQDVYGNRLIIVTAGEVIEDLNATAHVWSWYFAKEGEA